MTYSLEGCCPRSFQFNSIHAPARGATGERADHIGSVGVSIHAPAKGATKAVFLVGYHEGFQFTHPGRVRQSTQRSTSSQPGFQFTHPRGVRPLSGSVERVHSRFQFTHPRGVRRECGELLGGEPSVSIHAPARGATPHGATVRHRWRGFNSRTREGCDCRSGETAVGLPLQTYFSEGTQIIPSIRCRKHLKSYNRMSMSACECPANC